MTQNVDEGLSCLMDDELSRDERALLLARMQTDPALRQKWVRLNLARAGLQRHTPPVFDANFADRVMAALPDHELASSAKAERANTVVHVDFRRWLKPLGGFAIAASVAALAVMVAQPSMQKNTPDSLVQTSAGTLHPGSLAGYGNGGGPVMNVAMGTAGARTGASLPLQLLQTTKPQPTVVIVHDWAQLPADIQGRLNGYFISHGASSGGANPALLPRARLVGFEEAR
jgi:hypothetical protein